MRLVQRFLGLSCLLAVLLAPGLAWADLVLSKSAKTLSADGGSGSVSYTIRIPSEVPLSGSVLVETNQSWISIVSGGGDYTLQPGKKVVGTVRFRVEKNPSVLGREGTIFIALTPLRIIQRGAGCKLSISPASVTVGKDGTAEQHLEITATQDCGWAATSGSPWISISAESDSGTGTGTPQTVAYSVERNDVLRPRTGKVYVSTTAVKAVQKKTHTVKQPAQTMGTFPGTYGQADDRTMARIEVSDRGRVSGTVEDIWGDVWSVAGTLTPAGVLTARGTLRKGSGPTMTFEGDADDDGNLVVTARWTENGVPNTRTSTFWKKDASASPARYSFAETDGMETAGVFTVESDASVSGFLVNAWGQTYEFEGFLAAGKVFGFAQGKGVVRRAPGDDPLFAVVWGPYDGGETLELTTANVREGEEETREIVLLRTENPFVGVYSGTWKASGGGGSASGSWKAGVNADGGVEGYAFQRGNDVTTRIAGTVNLGSGVLSLTLYSDEGNWVAAGSATGSITAEGKVSATLSVPSEGVTGTFSGGQVW